MRLLQLAPTGYHEPPGDRVQYRRFRQRDRLRAWVWKALMRVAQRLLRFRDRLPEYFAPQFEQWLP